MNPSIKGICIFGYGRSGSTLLCEQLAYAIKKKHKLEAIPLYEILTPHCVLTPDHKELVVDNTGLLDRPIKNQLGLDRLERLTTIISANIFPVFKLFSTDLTADNRYLTESLIINNSDIYKICLNRADVVNQFLSWMISCATGVWHHYESDAKNEIEILQHKHTVNFQYAKSIAAGILLHYMWHFEVGYRKCQQTVWYDQLFQTDYPALQISQYDLVETQTKMNQDHISNAQKCITNFDEIYKIALRLENSVNPMLMRLKSDSDFNRS